jgi:probable S-adenosylmethionine-dependent methyltransferase, YraL family
VNPIYKATNSKQEVSKIDLKSGLYMVATPIGNLGDISIRALETLNSVDQIACEDTRVTKKLLKSFAISTRLTSYHEYNAKRNRPRLIAKMLDGSALALVSDAGTPTICDPGYKLVRECIFNNIPITFLPGASASLSGLVLSGLPTDRFYFHGYLAPKQKKRKEELCDLSTIPSTMVFYESSERLKGALEDVLAVLGNREIAVARELTKVYEEIKRGRVKEILKQLYLNQKLKGEYVVVLGPKAAEAVVGDEELSKILLNRMEDVSLKDAVLEVASLTKRGRQDIY